LRLCGLTDRAKILAAHEDSDELHCKKRVLASFCAFSRQQLTSGFVIQVAVFSVIRCRCRFCGPFRISAFGFLSDFGLRISAFGFRTLMPLWMQSGGCDSGFSAARPFVILPAMKLLTQTLLAFSFILTAGSVSIVAASFNESVGLQLYSLRAEFTRNVPDTLAKVRGYGIKEVELAGTYNLSPEKFKEMLEANQLKAISGHFPFERYRDDPEGAARDAKTLGLQYAGCAWIPHEGEFDEKECRAAIAVFNKAGEVLAKQGVKFFYHVHGFEFQPHGQGTLLDLLMAGTDPKLVRYQMDVFWIVFPGQDPVKLLEKYKGRWELMHLKDMKKGLATGSLDGKTDVSNDVTLGTGQLNWPAILAAAKKAGIKYYFIEDEAPTAAEQIPQSLKYLKTVKW
jgi:sugar phosphate isomerase/epimerase